jgi:hypothetical protein
MSESVGNEGTIEELPWGPGMIVLAQSLPVEIQNDDSTGTITIVSAVIGQWGQGSSYEEALVDLGLRIEQWFDAVTGNSRTKMSPDVVEALEQLLEYLPEDVQP